MKLVFTLLLTLSLTGCPSVMRGIVNNQSNESIVVHWQGGHPGAYKVMSASKQELFWERGCITVLEGEKLHHFDGAEIPVEFIDVHVFSTSLNLHYENSQLFYVATSGDRIELQKVASCQNV